MPLHLIKLSVGARSLDDLRAWQDSRPRPLCHTTRNFPRRAAEICDGGSIYWVINRMLTARQRVLDIVEGVKDDGSKGTDLVLDPVLVPVRGRLVKPFQGWRYLPAADAPEDGVGTTEVAGLPDAMKRDLASLGLL